MKLLWESNAPWVGTGYGAQTRLMLPALKAMGHEPSCFAFYGLSGGKLTYDGYDVYPGSGFEDWGNDVVKLHASTTKADAVITLMDLFILKSEIFGELGVPWIAWTPLDSDGIGFKTLQALKACQVPIAMSEFGAKQMQNYDIQPAGVIYHAVDTGVFKPMDQDECREYMGLDKEAYIVGMVMANKGDRKQYPMQLAALKQFADENPDAKIRGYFHTEPTPQMGGWDMRVLVDDAGLKGKVFSTNQYRTSVLPLESNEMSMLYNCFDVLLNCSAGEGFGIPIVEAQACGIPVVTHNVTAMPELTINGYTVESEGKGLASHYGWQYYPSIEDMVYRLNCVYRMNSSADNARGIQWVRNTCSLEVIASQWQYLLKSVQGQLDELQKNARRSYP